MNKEETIKSFKSLMYNAKANWDYFSYEILFNFFSLYNNTIEENKKLKDNYKNQIEHTTILAKALKLEEDAPIDEIYAEINKLKTNSIHTSVIQNKIEEVNNSNGYTPVNKIFIEKVLNEILEEGRNNK